MDFFIISILVFFLILILINNFKPNPNNTKKYTNNTKLFSEKKLEIKNLMNEQQNYNNSTNQLSTAPKQDIIDDTIIDISDQTYNIYYPLIKYDTDVPYWKQQYVYSYNEIESATNEQKHFYNRFKSYFLNDTCLDLEGNTNYAFILLFDLINEYEIHLDLSKLINQIKVIEEYYPITKYYGDKYLSKKLVSSFSDNTFNNRSYTNSPELYEQTVEYDYWKLGSKYKDKLNLSIEEEQNLNKLWYPNNNFCEIEYCFIEIIKLYNLIIKHIKNKFIEEGTTLEKEITNVSDIIAKKHYKYKYGSDNYNYSIETIQRELYSNIFKICENYVRELYNHKRKLNTDIYTSSTEVKNEIETKLTSKIKDIIPSLIITVSPPDELTEIQLNSQNTSRWKVELEQITSNYKNNPESFFESILQLGILNKKNPSIENIYFEGSKFIAKYDKVISVTLYLYYIYYDLKSNTFDNKQITKTIQKILFSTNEQLHTFEKIVSELITNKNLEEAIKKVNNIYEIKRKKIQLDGKTINEVQKLHSGTVDLLNEYLKDDFEDENILINSQELNNNEIEIGKSTQIDPLIPV